MRQDAQEQLALRLRQAAERADKLARPITARFLTGAERSLAIHAAREAGVEVAFDGGWSEAEKNIHYVRNKPERTEELADRILRGIKGLL